MVSGYAGECRHGDGATVWPGPGTRRAVTSWASECFLRVAAQLPSQREPYSVSFPHGPLLSLCSLSWMNKQSSTSILFVLLTFEITENHF